MSTEHLNLNEFLSDSRVQDDLLKALWDDKEECDIILESETIKVPRSAFLEVISKSYRENIYRVGFGNYYAAQVAIGGVEKQTSGILYPAYCFATLFYNSDRGLITIDVHPDMR